MALSLHTIKPADGSKKRKKRIGRGLAKKGTTAGRGQKGQKSRSGASGFQRRGIRQQMLAMPKLRGFNSPHANAAVVNVADLESAFKAGEAVTPKTLVEKGLIRSTKNGVKVLGSGEITVSLKVKDCAVSKSAAEKITNAGGTVIA